MEVQKHYHDQLEQREQEAGAKAERMRDVPARAGRQSRCKCGGCIT